MSGPKLASYSSVLKQIGKFLDKHMGPSDKLVVLTWICQLDYFSRQNERRATQRAQKAKRSHGA